MRLLVFGLLAFLVLGAHRVVHAEDIEEDIAILIERERPPPTAVLRGVDKITAAVTDIEAPLHQAVSFGTLEIVARSCRKRPPVEPPEVSAFLEITEIPYQGDPSRIFTGWMFASSPALNALEHPVYDVWVIDCKTSSPDS